jgi:hypothetical protein
MKDREATLGEVLTAINHLRAFRTKFIQDISEADFSGFEEGDPLYRHIHETEQLLDIIVRRLEAAARAIRRRMLPL